MNKKMTKATLENKKITNSKSGRIDFSVSVKETLYKRAARCSVPRCNKPTAGPFSSNAGAVNVGMACHIYSAAEEGPRGRGGKDDELIRSAENGIWCCSYHGHLIDKGRGADYPAPCFLLGKNWRKHVC